MRAPRRRMAAPRDRVLEGFGSEVEASRPAPSPEKGRRASSTSRKLGLRDEHPADGLLRCLAQQVRGPWLHERSRSGCAEGWWRGSRSEPSTNAGRYVRGVKHDPGRAPDATTKPGLWQRTRLPP